MSRGLTSYSFFRCLCEPVLCNKTQQRGQISTDSWLFSHQNYDHAHSWNNYEIASKLIRVFFAEFCLVYDQAYYKDVLFHIFYWHYLAKYPHYDSVAGMQISYIFCNKCIAILPFESTHLKLFCLKYLSKCRTPPQSVNGFILIDPNMAPLQYN